ncbi:Sua5/YciO/YrdC/YwlC family protein [Cocleimonas sp. KMM 6892]|uniref:Sua5/YciO/YrdC/YwlC family protein n=1 Tax=unclassified Cocleimonas TaxID=2639732 RepID=UPI002DB6E8D2|nr:MULTISPECIES: Sua5/YciO/YrdC/YwlC family protein [unclassified Cocleimonas]MEB8432569.1 Sua5/YciO/YrdC/YwlC family protein [Cocleimonas sp. KMM 6892]MEC4715428.1 Sua5/YciO/YrdC/YwlC family protein [Cocleimonas sp. KMM 6895]MEC4744953.1 Sua5/YciO/YrdC/YwlC family protein [Cocleimonas sp. KMM 6896]
MLITKKPQELINILRNGGVFAYPTEAVYGLGCNPDNEQAVNKILELKQRSVDKGLILIASDFSQVEKYLKPLNPDQLAFIRPSQTTYIYPASDTAPKWLTGNFNSLAVRISKLAIIQELCSTLDSALVSTSANLSGQEPARSCAEVDSVFHNKIDAILDGETGDLLTPTEIRDSITGEIIRA